MGYSQEHIEQTRKRILDCAGKLFRKSGYNGVGIDKIMNEAGLTRGGFYAHFRSKAHLFEAVIGEDFDFTNQVRKLGGDDSRTIENRAMFAMQYYIGTDQRDHVGSACTMASSAIDVSGAKTQTKQAFENRFHDLAAELSRLFTEDKIDKNNDEIIAQLSMCVGGLILARACNNEMAGQILNACRQSLAKSN